MIKPRAGRIGAVIATAALALAGCAGGDLGRLASAPPLLEQDTKPILSDRRAAPSATTQATGAAGSATATAATVSAPGQARDDRIAAALAHLERGEALAAQRLLADIEQPDWRVHSGLGVAASTLGRQKDAQSHFRKALVLSPDNQVVLNNLAVSYMLERKPGEAELVLTRARSLGNASAATLDNLALAKALKAQIASHGSGTGSAQ